MIGWVRYLVFKKKSMAVASKSKPKKLPSLNKPKGQTVPIPIRAGSAPLWLLRLCYLQRRSCVVTCVLVAAMLTVYAWTVYSQQRWSQAYRKLETLQRQERQLTTTSEVLKNEMALEAEQPAMGLMPSAPASTFFVVPAPQRNARAAESVLPTTKAVAQNKQPTPLPLGY